MKTDLAKVRAISRVAMAVLVFKRLDRLQQSVAI